MNLTKFRTTMFAGVVLMLAACTQKGTNEMNSYPYGSWVLAEVVQDGKRHALQGEMFTLVMSEEGQANGQVACNRWHGAGTATNDTLTVANAASTRRRCHAEASWISTLEMRYLRLLNDGATYVATDSQLTLTLSNNDQWLFAREQ